MFKIILLVLIILNSNAFAHEGGWTGGGGQLIEDRHNPWFLQNKKIVTYCIDIDEENFFVNEERADELIIKAFEYWKKEFKGQSRLTINRKKATVAQNNFVKVTCSQDTDIAFQLGYLTVSQKKKIQNYQDYLGFAFRTSYDKVNLKAKGFIYLAPEAPSNNPLRLEKPWSYKNNGLLYAALLHEIGHIWGLQDANDGFGVMNANLLDNITKKSVAPNMEIIFSKSHFNSITFRKDNSLSIQCYQSPSSSIDNLTSNKSQTDPTSKTTDSHLLKKSYRDFYGIPKNKKSGCIKRHLTPDNTLIVLHSDNLEGMDNYKIYGKAKLKPKKNSGYPYYTTAVQLWLTRQQQVFNPEYDYENYIYNTKIKLVPRQNWKVFTGTYQSIDKKITRQIIVKVSPEGEKIIGGLFEKKIYDNVESIGWW